MNFKILDFGMATIFKLALYIYIYDKTEFNRLLFSRSNKEAITKLEIKNLNIIVSLLQSKLKIIKFVDIEIQWMYGTRMCNA